MFGTMAMSLLSEPAHNCATRPGQRWIASQDEGLGLVTPIVYQERHELCPLAPELSGRTSANHPNAPETLGLLSRTRLRVRAIGSW